MEHNVLHLHIPQEHHAVSSHPSHWLGLGSWCVVAYFKIWRRLFLPNLNLNKCYGLRYDEMRCDTMRFFLF